MADNRASRAWAALCLTVAALGGTYLLAALNGSTRHGATASWNGFGEVTTWSVVMLSAAALGVLVSIRRPGNLVGWAFLASGLLGAIAVLGDQYAGFALVTRPGSIPGGVAARIVSYLSFSATWFAAAVLLPALFPTGRTLSKRWRVAVWLGGLGAAASGLMVFLPNAFAKDDLLGAVSGVRNPLGIAPLGHVLTGVSGFGLLGLFLGMFLAIISMVVRAVRSHGEERQQVKVVAYTVAIATALQVVVANLVNVAPFPGSALVWNTVSLLGIVAVPASLAVAVLRYRLYDVDRLINRTIVYALVSSLLAALYAGAVVLAGTVTRPVDAGSDIAVAFATLTIAGVFFPLRRRMQRFVDRRFYRTRYNAGRTLDDFVARLRVQTNLDALQADVERVASETLQPAHVRLWIAPGRHRRPVLR